MVRFKKIVVWIDVIIILALIIGFNIFNNSVPTSSTNKDSVKLSIELSIDKDSSTHVGNEWEFNSFVNDKPITENKPLILELNKNDKIKFEAAAVENDTSPDRGSNSGTENVSSIDLKNGTTYSFDVYVEEDKGRYKGSHVTHKFNFTVKQKLSLADKIKSFFS